MSYGAQIKLAIGRQTAAGSGNAVTNVGSFHHLAVISEDVGLEKDEVISANLTGRFEQGASYDGVSKIAGTIEFEATPKALGAVLTAVMGTPTTVTSGSLKTMTFFPSTGDYSATVIQQPFSIYKQFADATSAEHYFDTQFGQLDFQFSQGQLLRVRTAVAGGSRVATGIGSAGIVLDTQDLSLGMTWDTTSISWGGTAVGAFSDVTVSLNENIDALYTVNGTLSPYKFTRTSFREVTVNGTMYFDSRSAYNDFVSGTQRQLLINATAKKTQIQSGYYASLTVDVPQVKITQFKPGASGPGEVSVSFTGRGVIDPNSNYTLKVTLVNTYGAGY